MLAYTISCDLNDPTLVVYHDNLQPLHLRSVSPILLTTEFSEGDSRCTYVQNRHCACVFYQDWHRSRKPKLAVPGGILPAVNKSLSSTTVTGSHVQDVSPRNTLSINSGVVVAVSNDDPNFIQHPNSSQSGAGGQPSTGGGQSTGLSFDEEAKLVYGVVLSLRNMIKKLSGRRASPVSTLAEMGDDQMFHLETSNSSATRPRLISFTSTRRSRATSS